MEANDACSGQGVVHQMVKQMAMSRLALRAWALLTVNRCKCARAHMHAVKHLPSSSSWPGILKCICMSFDLSIGFNWVRKRVRCQRQVVWVIA
mmetsp:Transcript_70288/g.123902  ORF Transcript_70288/g.123902 Transcript_70288/m.123902 type:complete len:93 (+) Transcript_70288:431-709(+)